MHAYEKLQSELLSAPCAWLVTGVAGFIGSHLLEALLKLDQSVVGLDNFSTGRRENLDQVRALVSPPQWMKFRFMEGDICDSELCREACAGVDFALHEAALGSVPRSMEDPLRSHQSNVTGFLNVMIAARAANVRRVIYASSSAVYGDSPDLPKVEARLGLPLSPYAASKYMDEVYAGVFDRAFGLPSIGLRYFNVFGPRQDPEGAYAAVIPRWIAALLRRQPVLINGDGETSRDFCFIDNVVQANLLAAHAESPAAANQVYNIAVGEQTSLNELFEFLQIELRRRDPALPAQKPIHQAFRPGDVRHSLADISKARRLLGYQPTHNVKEGLSSALDWYRQDLAPGRRQDQ